MSIPEHVATRSLPAAPERRPYGLRKAIQAVKEAVSIEQVAVEYGVFEPVSRRPS